MFATKINMQIWETKDLYEILSSRVQRDKGIFCNFFFFFLDTAV